MNLFTRLMYFFGIWERPEPQDWMVETPHSTLKYCTEEQAKLWAKECGGVAKRFQK